MGQRGQQSSKVQDISCTQQIAYNDKLQLLPSAEFAYELAWLNCDTVTPPLASSPQPGEVPWHKSAFQTTLDMGFVHSLKLSQMSKH